MARVVIFFLLLAAVSGYAVSRGGAPERVSAFSLSLAALLTLALQVTSPVRFHQVEFGVLAIDAILFGVLMAIALYADRWWTLWVAAMQGLGTGAHVIKAVDPDTYRAVYAILVAAWSYPMLLLLLVGTIRHQRRVAAGGDRDWSLQRASDAGPD